MKALLDSKLNHRLLPASRVLFAGVLAIALLVPAAAVHASAKNEKTGGKTGNISGKVLEHGKEGVPGATVALTNSKTLKKISTKTTGDGSFDFPSIVPGLYRIVFSKAGFTTTEIPNINLKPSGDLTVVTTISRGSEGQPSTPQRVQGSKPPRVRVGGAVEAKKLVYSPSPEYPPLAKMARIQGTVELEAVIDAGGNVRDLRVLSGHPLLAKAALDAVRQWRYKLTYLNGTPVEVETTIDVNFVLTH